MDPPLAMVYLRMSNDLSPSASLDSRSAELDLVYAESVLNEAREALGSKQRVELTVAPLAHRSHFLGLRTPALNREDSPAMSMRWISGKSPAQLRVDPLALRLLSRDALKLGLVQQLARMPHERVFNALAAAAGPVVLIIFSAFWWFIGLTVGLMFLVAGALVTFPLVATLTRWSVYRADKRALQVCSGDVESFKALLKFDDWTEGDALREGTVTPSRLPWWLDCQPTSVAKLKHAV